MGMIRNGMSMVTILVASAFGVARSYHGCADDNFNGVYGLMANLGNQDLLNSLNIIIQNE